MKLNVKEIKTVTKTFHLELDEEEAKTLMVVVGNIVGSSISSRRKHTDAIYSALSLHFRDLSCPNLGTLDMGKWND